MTVKFTGTPGSYIANRDGLQFHITRSHVLHTPPWVLAVVRADRFTQYAYAETKGELEMIAEDWNE